MSMIAHVTSSLHGRFTSMDDKVDELIPENIFIMDYKDADQIKHLYSPADKEMYNVENIEIKIHECYLTLGITNKSKKVVGAVSIAEYPNVPSIPSDDWVTWLARIYGIKDVCSFNSFWIHLTLFDKAYAYTYLSILLKRIFEKHLEKNYILLIVPPVCFHQVGWMQDISSLILPIKCTGNVNKVQTVRLFVRQNFTTNYKIRRAVEEDNDDLIPLIDRFSPRLREMYGDYFIAEIITRHKDSGRHLIVAEFKGLAVGVLCLNGTVNYKDLQKGYDLTIFNDLEKMSFTKLKELNLSTASIYSANKEASRIVTKESSDSNLSSIENPSLTDPIEDDDAFEEYDFPDIDISLLFSPEELLKDKSEKSKFSVDVFSRTEYEISVSSESSSVNLISNSELVINENAFVIEIAAAEKDHMSSLLLLLEGSFECFPNRDYCILSVPTDNPFIPMLKYFTRIPPKHYCYNPYELYIAHRCILNPVSIKLAKRDDEDKIKNFCTIVKHSDDLLSQFNDAIKENTDLKVHLIFSGDICDWPMGIVVTQSLYDLRFLQLNYCLNTWINTKNEKNENFGVIKYFCMSPLFPPYYKFILREIHRKSGFMTLFYAMNRHDAASYRCRPFPTILSYLRQAQSNRIPLKAENDKLEKEPFSLFISTPRLTGSIRCQINTRIVVVGASLTSVAFLRALLYSSNKKFHIIFNNVTLVSLHGMCHYKQPNKILNIIRPKDSTVDFEYMEKLNLRCYVNIISGEMTAINRKDKTITVNEKLEVPYDMLFIMCGLQHNLQRNLNKKEFPIKYLLRHMFTINTETDVMNALVNVKKLIYDSKSKNYKIVVYGCKIDAYCCIEALLEYGIKPEHIILLEPFFLEKSGMKSHDFIFQDGEVYEAITEYLSDLGITMMIGYKLTDWLPREHGILLKLESRLRIVDLDALAVFLYLDKSVNIKAYEAIIRSGLVFDGRLVINHEFRTNDPFIYAAGPVTKYSRKYYADHLKHKYYNSEEIGENLGKRIRKYLIPFNDEDTRYENDLYRRCTESKARNLVPSFRKPLMTYCYLPGGLYYLNIGKPGVTVPLETAMSDDDYGSVLCTGSGTSLRTQGYFRLHLNPLNLIETITCLSATKFDWKKIILLWGKNEKLLNNLVSRFESCSIDDLFQYFESSWCTAIFHDDFFELEENIFKIMMSPSFQAEPSPLQNLISAFKQNGFNTLSQEEWSQILVKLKNSPYEDKIVTAVLDFIRDHLNTLDMYAHPILVNVMLTGCEESPLFKNI